MQTKANTLATAHQFSCRSQQLKGQTHTNEEQEQAAADEWGEKK